MSAVAKPSEDKSAAPVWWHGPDGELGVGAVQWPQFRLLMTWVWLPSFVFLFFSFNWATVLICFCSVFAIVRLSRLDGTPALVEEATKHWGLIFGGASVALFVLHLLDRDSDSSFLGTLYFFGGTGYFFATTIYFKSQRLLSWEPPRAKAVAAADVSMDDLKGMREEIEWAQSSLLSLPVFDDKQPDLLKAWESRDPPRIAHLLQQGSTVTQESWKRAISVHNRAASYTDRARSKLNGLLAQTEQRLAPFNLDYKTIEIERSKLGQVEFTTAIPKNLTVKRINAQNSAFIQGGSKAVAQSTFRQLPPLAAVAAIAFAIVAHQVYKSRTLRRLKDAEGQLVVNAEAARGDFSTIHTVLLTRIIPQFDSMVAIVLRLETGLNELVPNFGVTNAAQRDKALQLAFVMIEGKKLVATTAGN